MPSAMAPGGGVDADLAGREHKAAGDLRLRVGAEGCGSVFGGNCFHDDDLLSVDFYVITGLDKLAAHAVAVRLVADLARDVHVDLVGVEPGGEPVMLHGEDICAEGGRCR